MEQSVGQNGLNFEDREGRSDKTKQDIENLNDAANIAYHIQKIIGCSINMLNIHS